MSETTKLTIHGFLIKNIRQLKPTLLSKKKCLFNAMEHQRLHNYILQLSLIEKIS